MYKDRISSYVDYNPTMKIVEGFFLLGLLFNENWEIQEPPTGKNIKCQKIKNVTYYITPCKNGLEDVYDLIDNTIQYNLDKERKYKLFKTVATELKSIFDKESYEKLKTIKFTFGTSKAEKTIKPKKKEAKEKQKVKKNIDKKDSIITTKTENNSGEKTKLLVENNQTSMSDIDMKVKKAIQLKNGNN